MYFLRTNYSDIYIFLFNLHMKFNMAKMIQIKNKIIHYIKSSMFVKQKTDYNYKYQSCVQSRGCVFDRLQVINYFFY